MSQADLSIVWCLERFEEKPPATVHVQSHPLDKIKTNCKVKAHTSNRSSKAEEKYKRNWQYGLETLQLSQKVLQEWKLSRNMKKRLVHI